jgi:pimeloyl-ACP methyl ester carboxylesterase
MTHQGRIIIFIHGIGGKPRKETYLREWIDALRHSLWVDIPDDAFRLAYWADLRALPASGDTEREVVRALSPVQRAALVGTKSGKKAALPVQEKAVFAARGGLAGLLRRLLRRSVEVAEPLIRQFLDRFVDDVHGYFYEEGKRQQISQVLETELQSASDAGKRIALIAHSMGTVIALDVLKDRQVTIEAFVTMGSPLGSQFIQQKLGTASYPPGVRRWLNVFDGTDIVTLPDQHLWNDYTLKGARLVVDRMVRENFSPKGDRDPHHWFGYLSSQEVGDFVSHFWIAP